tara:strand:- start:26677 stop:26970 length:294 start_codon:yes stop_codon:yes gene_type:complete
MTTNNQPFDRIHVGPIQAAIWKNTGNDGRSYYSVTMEKRYRDANGDWQSTSSFHRDDMLVIGRVTDKVYDRISDAISEDRANAAQAQQAQQQTANAR